MHPRLSEHLSLKGDVLFEARRVWAPNGADRLRAMVENGFFDEGIGIFRCVRRFVMQFGIHGDPNNVSK